MHYDIIIIGAGSMGMAAGYYLAKSGKNTLLLDAFDPPHTEGSHHGETRIIRYAYGEGEKYVPLLLQSKKLWAELEKEWGQTLFTKTGVLTLGPKDSTFVQNVISSAKTYDLPLTVMTAKEVIEKWNGISVNEHLTGCFEPTSGVLHSERCIGAYRKLAEEEGATLLPYRKVINLTVCEERVTVETDNETFTSESLIVSGGAYSNELLSMLHLDLPLQPIRKTFAWFNSDEEIYNEREFPAFGFETEEGMYYGFPSINGAGLKVGRHDTGHPVDPNDPLKEFSTYKEDEQDLTNFLKQFIVQEPSLKYGKTCLYTMTPDEDFIVGSHPNYPNVAIAAGFSGHGFKFSSAIGKALSELITKGETEQDLSLFSLGRFEKKKLG
ncbi:N-methyl-L-tryptophan oxidase [Priestia endophytica]|uniref:N-methyltryptophan oxidase n=1 Tax=Priestia endophytica TaxID=135735 RepID=A0AAX1QGB3_9BACI|nr:N-methyl-L-tryptophan oxidase [Priestia endophytica]RAS80585.1 N-methyltryptophan oxidase [Priestia endophytica]RAS85971.1 N-methyltryptophan oxidase [Priestia endophytica]